LTQGTARLLSFPTRSINIASLPQTPSHHARLAKKPKKDKKTTTMFSKQLLPHAFILFRLQSQTGTATSNTTYAASPVSVRLPPSFRNSASTATWTFQLPAWGFGY